MGFPIVYNKTILKEHPFLAIFGLGSNFWVEQKVGGPVKTVRWHMLQQFGQLKLRTEVKKTSNNKHDSTTVNQIDTRQFESYCDFIYPIYQ